LTLRAPAKLNLCLYLGPRRDDGLHEIRSLFCPLTLADRIVVTDAGEDQVVCPGVEEPNLAGEALTALRARGWRRAPARVEIEKRIPVAAGLGGGSADAAALLRLARDEVDGLAELAADLGADVSSQLDPAFALIAGAGEAVEPLPPPREFGVVLLPAENGLRTAEVYAEADRLGLGRDLAELEGIVEKLRAATAGGASPLDYAELLVNDLGEAALSLRPEIAAALAALREAGAAVALVAGSGPTACGIFEDIVAADRAADGLPPRYANAIVAAAETREPTSR
jgi:4-diphosphocytidyl-2-C-methyl-D-erythritol kinase